MFCSLDWIEVVHTTKPCTTFWLVFCNCRMRVWVEPWRGCKVSLLIEGLKINFMLVTQKEQFGISVVDL